jgi:DNA adenine methylase
MRPPLSQPPLFDDPTIEPVSSEPFVKWPGGKSSELDVIGALAPTSFRRLVEPFVGGGSVLFALLERAQYAVANDLSRDLIELYLAVRDGRDDVREVLETFGASWQGVRHTLEVVRGEVVAAYSSRRDLPAIGGISVWLRESIEKGVLGGYPDEARTELAQMIEATVEAKLLRMRALEAKRGLLDPKDIFDNIHGAAAAALYYFHRRVYNTHRGADTWNAWRTGSYYVLREMAYAAMFRYNAKGEFNVPFGGISYAKKDISSKIAYMFSGRLSESLRNVDLSSTDFGAFLDEVEPSADDFVFLDPPYDSEFNAYDGTPFTTRDHRRLAMKIASSRARWLLVIKDTPLIRSLYSDEALMITQFDKRYAWNIKDRYDGRVEHLAITNYATEELRYEGVIQGTRASRSRGPA